MNEMIYFIASREMKSRKLYELLRGKYEINVIFNLNNELITILEREKFPIIVIDEACYLEFIDIVEEKKLNLATASIIIFGKQLVNNDEKIRDDLLIDESIDYEEADKQILAKIKKIFLRQRKYFEVVRENKYLRKSKDGMFKTYNQMAQIINNMSCGVIFLSQSYNPTIQEADYKVEVVNPVVLNDFGAFFEDELVGRFLKSSFRDLKNSQLLTSLQYFTENSLFVYDVELKLESKYLTGWYYFKFIKTENGIIVQYSDISKMRKIEFEIRNFEIEVN